MACEQARVKQARPCGMTEQHSKRLAPRKAILIQGSAPALHSSTNKFDSRAYAPGDQAPAGTRRTFSTAESEATPPRRTNWLLPAKYRLPPDTISAPPRGINTRPAWICPAPIRPEKQSRARQTSPRWHAGSRCRAWQAPAQWLAPPMFPDPDSQWASH